MKRRYDADPAWNKGGGSRAKKKCNVKTRNAQLRLTRLMQKKLESDRRAGKDFTVCVTRTVENPAIQTVGGESSKLLFALALGLTPSLEKKSTRSGPVVQIERLHPAVEAEARARTDEIIYQIFMSRKQESLNNRVNNSHCGSPEVVDLVSSDEEGNTDDDPEFAYHFMCSVARNRADLYHRPSLQTNYDLIPPSGNYKVITPSQNTRKPVFKPIGNNQDRGVFSNWKPESMSRLINGSSEKEDQKHSISKPKFQSSFLSSLANIPMIAPQSTRKYLQSVPTGSNCRSHVHGVLEDASSSVSSSIIPDSIITID